jgi:hypothetical protein
MSADPLEITGTDSQPSLNTKPLFKLMVDRGASDLFQRAYQDQDPGSDLSDQQAGAAAGSRAHHLLWPHDA